MILPLGSVSVPLVKVPAGGGGSSNTSLSILTGVRPRLWAPETASSSQHPRLDHIANTQETRETVGCDLFVFSYCLGCRLSKLSTSGRVCSPPMCSLRMSATPVTHVRQARSRQAHLRPAVRLTHRRTWLLSSSCFYGLSGNFISNEMRPFSS